MDRSGEEAHQVPGPARPHLLAGLRRASAVWAGHQRSCEERQDQGADRHRPRSSDLKKRIKFQGLPARICWLGYGERAQFGLAINDLVKKGKIKAPIVIGRDHLDCGSVASPFRETESM